jgi:5-methylthioribose kinase
MTDQYTDASPVNGIPEYALASLLERFPDFVIDGRPEQLSGGFLNYVWRIKSKDLRAPQSVIIKWTPAYIASAPDVALDPARIFVEAGVMSAFEAGGALEKISPEEIRPPHLYKLDKDHKLIIMEDLGQSPSLGEWLQESHTQLEAKGLGDSLGKFIGTLHRETAHQSFFARMFDNNQIQNTRLEFQYRNIQTYAEWAGLADADGLGKQAVQFGEHLQQPGHNLIMGDLWPASVIVTDSGVRIIDWELAHYGYPSQDVGHLSAHLWMHAHRASNPDLAINARTILKYFLEAYRDVLGNDFDSLFGVEGIRESSIHFGSEILTRTVGAFQNDYVYNGLAHDDPVIQEAVQIAAAHIRTPLDMHTFDPLGWRAG